MYISPSPTVYYNLLLCAFLPLESTCIIVLLRLIQTDKNADTNKNTDTVHLSAEDTMDSRFCCVELRFWTENKGISGLPDNFVIYNDEINIHQVCTIILG